MRYVALGDSYTIGTSVAETERWPNQLVARFREDGVPLELVAHLPATRVVTVSVPDYTVTPSGADFGDPARQAGAIVEANRKMARLSSDRGIAHVDILDISRAGATDRSLVAEDRLHPSGAQYRLWVERITPVVAHLLSDRSGGRAR